MSGVPHRCPACVTDDGDFWAYGRLVFSGEEKPTCAICGGQILPCSAFRVPNRLTTINPAVYSRQVAAPLPISDQEDGATQLLRQSRVGESSGQLSSGVRE